MKRPDLTPERRRELLQRLDSSIQEDARVEGIARNASAIYDAYSREFSERTGLRGKDWEFLFSATALQILRQYLLTAFPERLDDQSAAEAVEGKDKVREERELRKEDPRKHRYYNPSVDEILIHPVPFDANVGADGALSGAGSMGHRGATPGHDPIVGLVIGTSNIATSTLTNWTFESWHIKSGERKNGGQQDVFGNHADTSKIFSETVEKLLRQGREGRTKVAAALGKEVLHLRTDMNTKKGLPLPGIGALSPKFASTLADYGVDFANTLTVGKQTTYAALINMLTAMLHGLFYNPEEDGDIDLYKVRTKKILIYSNAIASVSNAMVVGFTQNTRYLDLGGYAVALYELVTGVNFIERVREDFIVGKFDNLINHE